MSNVTLESQIKRYFNLKNRDYIRNSLGYYISLAIDSYYTSKRMTCITITDDELATGLYGVFNIIEMGYE